MDHSSSFSHATNNQAVNPLTQFECKSNLHFQKPQIRGFSNSDWNEVKCIGLWWGYVLLLKVECYMGASAHQDSLSGERNVVWSFICILATPSGKECSLGPASYPVIWATVTNADSQASPRWTGAGIFTRSLVDSIASLVWDTLSWRMLFDLLCHHQLTFWQGFVLGNTQTCGVDSILLICVLDWSCWGLL